MAMRWNLADPPREVPLLVRLRVLFGGFLNQFGWLFFGFGMVFVWAFTARSDLTSWYVFHGELAEAAGRVTRAEDTRCAENEVTIYANHYQFTTDDGRKHAGVSYARGQKLAPGEDVSIEYLPGRPEVSRIAGMRPKPFGPWPAFVVIFPVVGACLVVPGLVRGLRGARLLRNGKQAYGRLIDKSATRTRVNQQRVWKFTFEFTADDGRTYQVSARTHETDKLSGEDPGDLSGADAATTASAERGEAVEPVVYDPFNPRRAAVLDALPGGPRIDESGRIRVGSPLRTLLVLAIPFASVVGHGAYLLARLT